MRHVDASHRGGRLAWCLVMLALLLTLLTVPTAAADGHRHGHRLEHRKHKVERRIHAARDDLAASTRRLKRAKQELVQIRRRLDRARDRHHDAHRLHVAAAEVDDRARADLDVAETALARAAARVHAAADRIAEQEAVLRSYAVDAFQSGDAALLSLSLVLTTEEPADLMGRLGSLHTVVDRQAVALSRLRAARVVQEIERANLEESRDVVADRRARAAETLRERQVTDQAAREARAEVRALADQAHHQKKVAAKARADDLKRLHKIRKERARVKRMLRRYHAAQRRKAHAAHRAPARGNAMPWPAHGWVSSRYGMRLHPVYHRWTLHDGLDVAANCGRPVRATASGRVVARYYNVAYGKRVVIGHGLRHGVGLATAYNHLSRFSTFRGQHVRRGDVIGFVGSTGYSTGCHLHFMVMRNGRPVNPRPWLR